MTAVVLGAATMSCSDGPEAGPDPGPTPTATPTPTPTEPATPEEKASAQLTAYLEVRDDALRAATIDFKRLNKVATGEVFLSVQQNVSAIERSGSKLTGQYVHTLAAPRGRGAYVLIIDCEDRSGIEQTKDGKPVPDEVGPDGRPVPNPLPIEYKLVKEKGRWLVSEQNGLLGESC